MVSRNDQKLCVSFFTTKVMKRQSWNVEYAQRVEKEYLRYLEIHRKNPRARISPSLTVDEIWHEHILNTRDYHTYCQETFGHYLHHRPNQEGEVIEDDDTELKYREIFGEDPPPDIWKACSAACRSWCGLSCSPCKGGSDCRGGPD